jgi:hypothetical protein
MSRTPDSPRWCDKCQAWGDHHTDRHPDARQAMTVAVRIEQHPRVTVAVRIDPRLVDRANAYGAEHGLKLRQVIELALAEKFAVPPALEGHEIGLTLCPACEQAIIAQGRCEACNWHVYPRPWKPKRGTRARQSMSTQQKASKLR